ncbi:MAG: adenylate/guanylate cyclase domain-containing protein [Pseudomonadota bacterium]
MSDKTMAATLAQRCAGAAWRLGWALGDARVLAAVALIAIVALRLHNPAPMEAARYQAFDLLQQTAPRVADAGKRVAIVDIDEASIAAYGQWPWDRSRMGELVEALDEANVAAMGFDIVFSEPDRLSPPRFATHAPDIPLAIRGVLAGLTDTDAAFAKAIADAPVVLGASGKLEQPGLGATDLAGGAVDPVPSPFAEFGGDPRPHVFAFPKVLRNVDVIEEVAAGRGLFSLTPEPDGVVRRAPAILRVGDKLHPSLSIETLRVGLGAGHIGVWRSPAGLERLTLGGLEVPTDPNGRLWMRYAEHDPALYVSAKDVLERSLPADWARGKYVLIGTSAVGLRDLRLTPLGQTVPGVEVHAQAIDSALIGAFLNRPASAVGLEHLVAVGIGVLLILLAPKLDAGRGMIALAAALIGLAGGAWSAMVYGAYVFDWTYPALAATATLVVIVIANFAKAEAQRRRVRSAFSHYLSPDLVKQLSETPDALQLGGESREMTFLFCDIAGFTSFVERAEPATLVALLNEYLDGVCRIVMAHNGTIDKIVGDAVHAMFNAPLDDPDHAANAVRCALEIEAFVKEFRAAKQAEGHDFGETRIGVNTGRAVVGNFGGGSRFDYTAHGDAINTAARLEGANKHLGTSIIISGTAARLCPQLPFRPIGRLYLKGKDVPVEAFDPVRPDRAGVVAPYRAAYDTLEAGGAEAEGLFRELAAAHPDDALAALHLKRLASGAAGADIVMAGK